MEEYVKCALEIVKAQASVRTMTDEEITSMVRRLAAGIRDISGDVLEGEAEQIVDMEIGRASRRERV